MIKMGISEQEQEPVVGGRIGDVKAQIEAKKKEIDQKEKDLQTQLEMGRQSLAEMEAELKEAQWQEKLERVEKQLVQLYREERKKENEINQAINKVFNKAARDVKKINFIFKDLNELKKNISSIENQLIRSDDTHDLKIKEAIEFKKAEITREIEVTEEVKGGVSLVREVNVALGIQEESDQELFGRIVNRLPVYAQNIYDEVIRAGGKPVKAKEDELIRVAKIPEPRIIKARDELKKNLKVLVEKDLITYEAEGKTLILKENNIKV
jgi:hypothetical protein